MDRKIFMVTSVLVLLYRFCVSGSNTCPVYDSHTRVTSLLDECVVLKVCSCRSAIDVFWKFNGAFIFARNQTLKNDGNWEYCTNKSLKIYPVDLSNVGNYTCSCNGEIRKSYFLTLIDKDGLHFYVTVNDTNYTSSTNFTLNISDSQYVTLACHADGGMNAVNLTWRVDGNIINASTRVQHSRQRSRSNIVTELKSYTFVGHENISCVRRNQYNQSEEAIWIKLVTFDQSPSSPPVPFSTTERSFGVQHNVLVFYTVSSALPLIAVTVAVLLITQRRSKERKNQPGRIYEECAANGNLEVECSSMSFYRQGNAALEVLNEGFPRRDCVILLSSLSSGDKMKYWTAVLSTDDSKKSIFVAKTLSDSAHLKDLYNFQKVARKLQVLTPHKNIVDVLGIDDTGVPCFVYHHFEEGGTLRDFMLKSFDRRRESELQSGVTEMSLRLFEERKLQLIRFALDVADGMEFLRGNNFCHPGICSRKVLLSRNGTCKLYDFVPEEIAQQGMISLLDKKSPPLAWLPPESIFLRRYSWQADAWSFGVVLWEIFSLGQTPYEGLSTEEIETEIRCERYLSQPMCCPGGVYSIMLSSWNISYEDRPTFLVITKNLKTAMESFKQECDWEKSRTEDANYFVLEEPTLENEYEF